MAKNLPSDLEGAEQTGFLHGTRQKIVKCRAEMFVYRNKAGQRSVSRDTGQPIPPSPAIVVEYQNPATKAKSQQKYLNGNPTDRKASEDGSGFVPVREGVKHALVKGGEAYKLLSSIVAAGYPANRLAEALADYRKFEGMVVEIQAMPVGKPSADLGADQSTIPVVGAIVQFPWGERNPLYGVTGPEAEEPEEEEEDEPPAPKPRKRVVEEEEEEEEAPKPKGKVKRMDPVVAREAGELVAEVLLQKKYRKTGVDLETLAEEVGERVNGTKHAPAILKLVQDPEWLAQLEGAEWDDEDQVLRAG